MVKEHLSKMHGRPEDTHKGDFGHVFVVAGSTGMTGAAYLASQGALLSGSGLVTCGIPKNLNTIMEIKLTEAMTLPLSDTKDGALNASSAEEISEFSKKCDALALGPGLGRQKETLKAARSALKKVNKPVVLDADGIISLVGKTDILKNRRFTTVLTPHPGEFSKLTGKDVSAIQRDREKTAKAFAKKHNVVLVLKGHRTVVASPKGAVYVNTTGNSGMSSGGVGDVLTGMIASFIGQGIDSYSASVIGVYVHGLAGDMAAREKGQFSLIASDILEKLPEAIQEAI